MAMTTCSECKHSISTKAAACPQCGAVRKGSSDSSGDFVVRAFLLLIFLGIGAVVVTRFFDENRGRSITIDSH